MQDMDPQHMMLLSRVSPPTIDESSTGEDTHEQDQPDYFNSNFPGEASDKFAAPTKILSTKLLCMYVCNNFTIYNYSNYR